MQSPKEAGAEGPCGEDLQTVRFYTSQTAARMLYRQSHGRKNKRIADKDLCSIHELTHEVRIAVTEHHQEQSFF
jgi:hypothetical protein